MIMKQAAQGNYYAVRMYVAYVRLWPNLLSRIQRSLNTNKQQLYFSAHGLESKSEGEQSDPAISLETISVSKAVVSKHCDRCVQRKVESQFSSKGL